MAQPSSEFVRLPEPARFRILADKGLPPLDLREKAAGKFHRTAALGLLAISAMLGACSTMDNTSFDRAPVIDKVSATRTLYRLRPGDIVQVDVFQEPLMTSRQRVLADGTISVGYVGSVGVGGKTIEEARTMIAGKLSGTYLVNPQVSITVLAYAPRRFTVWGHVNNASTYLIPPEETLYLPDAIAMAGGQTALGNLKKVLITRKVDGQVKQIRVNSLSPEMQTFKIEEGDIIFITETKF